MGDEALSGWLLTDQYRCNYLRYDQFSVMHNILDISLSQSVKISWCWERIAIWKLYPCQIDANSFIEKIHANYAFVCCSQVFTYLSFHFDCKFVSILQPIFPTKAH